MWILFVFVTSVPLGGCASISEDAVQQLAMPLRIGHDTRFTAGAFDCCRQPGDVLKLIYMHMVSALLQG